MKQSPSSRQVSKPSLALRQLRQRLQQPGPWAERFRQLAVAIARAEGLTCDECQDLLELCLDDAPLPPAIQQHLEMCSDCQEAYHLLRVAIAPRQEDPSFQLQSASLRPPSFLQPLSADAPWITRLRSRLAGGPFGIAFSFNLAYLLDLFTAAHPLLARGDAPSSSSGQVLLLSQIVHLGAQILSVTATADRDRAQADHVQVEVTITSPDPLPQTLWARLTWGEQTWAARVGPDGRVCWSEIPLTPLHAPGAGRFALDIEVREDPGDAPSPLG